MKSVAVGGNAQRISQSAIYNQLRQRGSTWLKKHVIYADRQIAVLNKPPGLVCQVDHAQKRADEVRFVII